MLLILFATAASGGLLATFTSLSGATRGDHDASAWSAPSTPDSGGSAVDFYAALTATGHFGAIEEADPAFSTEDAGPPIIAMTALADGAVIVSTLGQDGTTSSFEVGDVLPGGWRLTDASLDAVTFEREGEILQVQVYPKGQSGS